MQIISYISDEYTIIIVERSDNNSDNDNDNYSDNYSDDYSDNYDRAK